MDYIRCLTTDYVHWKLDLDVHLLTEYNAEEGEKSSSAVLVSDSCFCARSTVRSDTENTPGPE